MLEVTLVQRKKNVVTPGGEGVFFHRPKCKGEPEWSSPDFIARRCAEKPAKAIQIVERGGNQLLPHSYFDLITSKG